MAAREATRGAGWGWTGLVLLGALSLSACGRGPVYQACERADECAAPEDYEPACIEKSGEGFCTWSCSVDDDCADADDRDFRFVCASFESQPGMHCFPGCEDVPEGREPCPRGMGCRSTGGGSGSRKICFPDGS